MWGQVSSHMKIFVCGQVSSHIKLNKVSLKSLNFSCIHGVLLHHVRHNQRHNMNCLLYSENAITMYPHGTYRAFLQGSLYIYRIKIRKFIWMSIQRNPISSRCSYPRIFLGDPSPMVTFIKRVYRNLLNPVTTIL